jgi:membrane protein YdbS with pleckstrin-like domain
MAIRTAYFWIPFLGLSASIIVIIVSSKRATSTAYTLSRYGISKEQRFLIHHMTEIPFDRISHITISRDLSGKIFHFGTVTLNSASISFNSLVLPGIREPEELRRLILATREKAMSH